MDKEKFLREIDREIDSFRVAIEAAETEEVKFVFKAQQKLLLCIRTRVFLDCFK